MRIAYLDCFSGISGDMFLGALVDAGVSAELLRDTVRKLNLGAEIEITRVERAGIAATKVDVIVNGIKDMPRDEVLRRKNDTHAHLHSHTHAHEHTHPDGTVHSHEHAHVHAHPHAHDDPAHSHPHTHALETDPEHEYHDGPQVHAHDHRVPGSVGSRPQLTNAAPELHAHTHTHVHSHEHTHADGTTHSHDHAHQHSHPHAHDDPAHAGGHESGIVPDAEHQHNAPEGVHEHQHWDERGDTHSHRGLKEIRAIIGRAEIPPRAKERALAMFQALGEAEAKIHNVSVEAIHFHEVGSVDAIVDIVCAAVGAEALHVDRWLSSPLNVGGGTVDCAHGTLPVPAPATLELLKDAPVYSSGLRKELVTPTGAAIVKTLVSQFSELPMMKVTGTGYGAGTRDFRSQANVVRLTVGDAVTAHASGEQDTVTVIEANIDDLNPQVFGYVIEHVLSEGALDAFGTPVQMKKSRPGMVLTVLTRPDDAQRIAAIIFAETTTIGLRMREERRQTLHREWLKVHTQWGEVRIKIAEFNGAVSNFAPEYEDCKRIAAETGAPLKQIMQEAVRAYLETRDAQKVL
jgi:pyridinium-3,5-bisthiocarboxylic acid mononucleotide nickel chelatase